MIEDNVEFLSSDFEQIKKRKDGGKEYWSSRDLCAVLGYSTYQKFTRIINKAIAIANNKGFNVSEHFNQTVEMVKVGSGSFRKVENIHLSRYRLLDYCGKCRWKEATSTNGKRIFQARDIYS